MNDERALQSVDELLKSIVNSDVDILRDASRHILEAGGKRIRPRLTLLAYEAVGGMNLAEAVPVAAAWRVGVGLGGSSVRAGALVAVGTHVGEGVAAGSAGADADSVLTCT